MSRNSVVILGVTFFAFVMFITLRGELVQYMATLGLAPKSKLPKVS